MLWASAQSEVGFRDVLAPEVVLVRGRMGFLGVRLQMPQPCRGSKWWACLGQRMGMVAPPGGIMLGEAMGTSKNLPEQGCA